MKKQPWRMRILVVFLMTFLGSFSPVRSATSLEFGRVIYEKNSLYNSIYVYQKGAVTTLRFGKRGLFPIQSQVDLNHPRIHMLEYSKLMFCGLFYQSQPERILVLGLGGGVIPREMRYYFPDSQIDVVEIDPDIPPIATKYMGFKEDDKLRVHVEDGRMFVKKRLRREEEARYNFIILDAFNSEYIPFHLMTREFLQQVKGILADDGIVVANVFSSNQLFDAEFKTFLEVFGRCQAYFGDESTNAMLAAPGPSAPILTQREAIARARQLQETLKPLFSLPKIAGQLSVNAIPDPEAKVLTDDLAPVNWLRDQETRIDRQETDVSAGNG
jgi:spermidine synthase